MKIILLFLLFLFSFSILKAQDTLTKKKYFFSAGIEKLNILNKDIYFEYARPYKVKNNSYGINFNVVRNYKYVNLGLKNELLLLNTIAYYEHDLSNTTDTTRLKLIPSEFDQNFKTTYYNLSLLIGANLFHKERFSIGLYLIPGISLPLNSSTEINAKYLSGVDKNIFFKSSLNNYYERFSPLKSYYLAYTYFSSELEVQYNLKKLNSIGLRFGIKTLNEYKIHDRNWMIISDDYVWFLGKYYNVGLSYVKKF
jgi:hypothetical protein